jgi:UDP-4-amino-4,6-dideoxy-N-acetyl-beta-L-altrosamine transaminase
MIPYGRQDVTDEDIDAVVEVLRSDFLTQGPAVPRFERAVAEYVGCRHALAVNSATSALHIACLALDLGPGDWLWTSPITFVASANCALYCGARVDFVDIDPRTYNLCPEALAIKLERARRENRLPKVLVPVHFSGQSCDMAAIHKLSQEYGFRVIEDASHAIGARYRDERVGNCRYSDIAVFSFHPVKIITTAEGGMAVTNDPELARRMDLLRSHGITRDPAVMTKAPTGAWYYEQVALGFNYRLTDVHAALGSSQLARLDSYLRRRHQLAERYGELLAGMPLVLPSEHPHAYSSLHLYVVQVPREASGEGRARIFAALRSAGIGVNVHYIPVHTQPHYQDAGFRAGDFPVAEAYYARTLTLPLYPAMTERQQDEVVAALQVELRK